MFNEVRIFGQKSYANCWLPIMTESTAVSEAFRRLTWPYKIKAPFRWINIRLLDKKTYDQEKEYDFRGTPSVYCSICEDMERLDSSYNMLPDEEKRLLFFNSIQKTVEKCIILYNWDANIFQKIFLQMQQDKLLDEYFYEKKIWINKKRYLLSIKIVGDLYDYKFFIVLYDSKLDIYNQKLFMTHTTRDRFVYWATIKGWTIENDSLVCWEYINKYFFSIPDLECYCINSKTGEKTSI